MRSFLRPWIAVAVAAVLLAACSDGDDSSSTTTAPDATTSSVAEETTTTAPPTTTAGGDDAADEDAIRAQFDDVIDGMGADEGLEPAEEDCLVQEVLADDDLRASMVDGQDFDDLPPEMQQQAVLLAIDCAPQSLSRAAVGSLDLDVDEATEVCLQDGLASDPDLLRGLALVGLSADEAADVDEIPADLVLALLGLVEECGVPLSSL